MIENVKKVNPAECFAYGGEEKCKLMKKLDCENCAFFKTYAQNKADIEHCYSIIRRKPLEEQERISETYYGGKMPWLEREEEEV